MRKFALAILALVIALPAFATDPNSPLSARHPDVKHVDSDSRIKAPIVVRRVAPRYSEEARKARVTGIVILEALVDRNGDVKDAAVVKDVPFDLGAAAVEAVMQWKFKPATLERKPIDVIFNLTVHFKLE
jgi:TonB family protein